MTRCGPRAQASAITQASAIKRAVRANLAGMALWGLVAVLWCPEPWSQVRAQDRQSEASAEAETSLVERGKYLVRAGGCVSCHTEVKGKGKKRQKGPPLAGGRAIKTPFGIFYSPNITPDPETGIGNWTDADFIRALRKGVRPDGAHYFPVFPYTTYTNMREDDMRAIKAYLFSLEPVRRKNRRHEVRAPFGWRWPLRFWKILYFKEGPLEPDPSRDAVWNRGRYLVEALTHCGECHTPRNWAGALDRTMWMAGTRDGPEGEVAPNITSDGDTGIGGWSEEQLVTFLKTGFKPDWENAIGLMAEAIEESTRHLTDDDLKAIARHMATVPPIRHSVGN